MALCVSLMQAMITAPPARAQDAAASELAIPGQIQASSPMGVVVRVKGVAVTEDVTLLRVSASYGASAGFTELAADDRGTYLEDEDGARYPVRLPRDNRWLRIRAGDTMEGQLVFLGRIAAGSNRVKLVINHGAEAGDSDGNPHLEMDIPISRD